MVLRRKSLEPPMSQLGHFRDLTKPVAGVVDLMEALRRSGGQAEPREGADEEGKKPGRRELTRVLRRSTVSRPAPKPIACGLKFFRAQSRPTRNT
jgi:hypothetical protein